jgi:EAL domain-containing protein (putative c-di-GMP-specific phosphodiesterase class I)
VHCSVGVTLIDGSDFSSTELLSQADTACHEAKNHGRDCFKLYRDIAPEEILALEGSGIREQLEHALEQGCFALSYYPVTDCATGKHLSFEAFVQMNSGGRDIPARAFFAAAERFDLAPRIDRWVISEALRQLAACSNPETTLSINLSPRTLPQPDIVDFICDRLAAHDLNPRRISFELAERTVLDSVTQTKNFMEKVREVGCAIVIDDFGVSLNSLNLLRHLPVAQIKIEASLVNNAAASSFNQAVIASIVRIASELNIVTVAKGVMRSEDEELLCHLGIQAIQKHELSPPYSQLPALTA